MNKMKIKRPEGLQNEQNDVILKALDKASDILLNEARNLKGRKTIYYVSKEAKKYLKGDCFIEHTYLQ